MPSAETRAPSGGNIFPDFSSIWAIFSLSFSLNRIDSKSWLISMRNQEKHFRHWGRGFQLMGRFILWGLYTKDRNSCTLAAKRMLIFRFYLQVIRILIHLKIKLWSEFKLLLITHHRKLSQMPLLIFYLVSFILILFRLNLTTSQPKSRKNSKIRGRELPMVPLSFLRDERNPNANVLELSLLEERFRQQLKEHSEGNNYD